MSAFDRVRRLAPFGVESDDRDARPYVCRGCGSEFTLWRHVCPECEGFSVERR